MKKDFIILSVLGKIGESPGMRMRAIIISLIVGLFSILSFAQQFQLETTVDRSIEAILDIDGDGICEYVADTNPLSVPVQFQLFNNYPNPFNPSTKIKYSVPEVSFVTIKVYDFLGREVSMLVNEEKAAGSYEVDFSAKGGAMELASGIYLYRIQAGEFHQVRKMLLMK